MTISCHICEKHKSVTKAVVKGVFKVLTAVGEASAEGAFEAQQE
jgi:hypothetical protein